jgi:hypothetical protein
MKLARKIHKKYSLIGTNKIEAEKACHYVDLDVLNKFK